MKFQQIIQIITEKGVVHTILHHYHLTHQLLTQSILYSLTGSQVHKQDEWERPERQCWRQGRTQKVSKQDLQQQQQHQQGRHEA